MNTNILLAVMSDNDGFSLVKYKHPKRIKPSHKDKLLAASVGSVTQDDDNERQVHTISQSIQNCKLEISSSSFYKELSKSILQNISENLGEKDQLQEPVGKFTDFVCYGIGKLSESKVARYQFALLVLLWEQLKPGGVCYIYDPVFSCLDKIIIRNFGLALISKNEEAKRKVLEKTLFFIPHGGKPLYNNLLWVNWGLALTNVVLLGNSFNSYHERIPSVQLHFEAPYIAQILPLTHEVKFPTTFYHDDIFNDLSVHFFLACELQGQPASFWQDRKEPVYEDDNVEIVLNTLMS